MASASASLLTRCRALPRAVWVLCLGQFINRFGTFVMPMLTLYLTRSGFSEVQSTLAVGAYGGGLLVASLFGGWLADRVGRRNAIMVAMFGGAALMLALSQARSYPAIVTLTFFTGLFSELYRPAAGALIADLVPEGERVTAWAVYRFALNAGFACGPAIAGLIAARGFFWLFAGDAITSACFGVVALALLPQGHRAPRAESGWMVALRAARRDRSLQVYLAAMFLLSLALPQLNTNFALHTRDLGLSTRTFGLLLSLNGLIIIVCELPLIAITRRLPARPVMAAGMVVMGVGFGLIPGCATAVGLTGMMLLWTTGEMLAFPVMSAFFADLAPRDLRGRYLGLNGVTWALGNMLGPPLGTMVYQLHPSVLWLACAALCALAALFAAGTPAAAGARPR